MPQWPQNSAAAISLVPQCTQYFTSPDPCGCGFWVARLRLDSRITKAAANTITIAATAANVIVRLPFSGAAGELKVVKEL